MPASCWAVAPISMTVASAMSVPLTVTVMPPVIEPGAGLTVMPPGVAGSVPAVVDDE